MRSVSLTPLLLLVLLTGCGAPVAPGAASAVSTKLAPAIATLKGAQAPAIVATGAASVTVTPGVRTASEVVPTTAQLAALGAASPDELVASPPGEPGEAGSMSAASLTGWLPWPKPPAGDLANFGKVNDSLFRGARPTDAGLAKLQAMGVKTIVDFENDAAAVAHEQAWCAAHGIAFHSIALSVVTPPKAAKIQEFLGYAQGPAATLPLYFHCMQGRDRTGTAAFCYRVSHDHWDFTRAYAEMKSYSFHTYLLGLQGFIREYAENHPAT